MTKHNDEAKLLPCPFCGSAPVFDEPSRGYGMWVRCTGCMADMFGINETDVTNARLQRKAVAKNWNTRIDKAMSEAKPK